MHAGSTKRLALRHCSNRALQHRGSQTATDGTWHTTNGTSLGLALHPKGPASALYYASQPSNHAIIAGLYHVQDVNTWLTHEIAIIGITDIINMPLNHSSGMDVVILT